MTTNADGLVQDWERSYERHENFVFWPADAVVRFVSRHLRKRTGLTEVRDVMPGAAGSRVLDLGCGIGRNIHFGQFMGLEMYGIELSSYAVGVAREWMRDVYKDTVADRIQVGDVRALPWADGFFDHAISDSVLDSMNFEIARQGVAEVARTLKPGGLFYLNLIAERPGLAAPFVSDERLQTTQHEQGTIQSYFDESKIVALLGAPFELVNLELHTIQNVRTGTLSERWHVVARRR